MLIVENEGKGPHNISNTSLKPGINNIRESSECKAIQNAIEKNDAIKTVKIVKKGVKSIIDVPADEVVDMVKKITSREELKKMLNDEKNNTEAPRHKVIDTINQRLAYDYKSQADQMHEENDTIPVHGSRRR